MSTDISVYSNSTLEQRKDYAQTLTNAGDLIPKGLWGSVRPNPEGGVFPAAPSPGKVLLVMETGAMLGLHPVAALQGVHIIEGKATLSPALMSAVVRKAGHKLRVSTSGTIAGGDFAATATLVRSDDPDFTYSATWTIDRATRAGLASKDVWKKYGEAMCKARAISEVCREGAEDALMGIQYTPEELDAEVTEGGEADVAATIEPSENWAAAIESAESKAALQAVRKRADAAGEYSDEVRSLCLARAGVLGRAGVVPVDLGEPEPEPEVTPPNEEIAVEVPDEPTEPDPAEPSPEEYAEIKRLAEEDAALADWQADQ